MGLSFDCVALEVFYFLSRPLIFFIDVIDSLCYLTKLNRRKTKLKTKIIFHIKRGILDALWKRHWVIFSQKCPKLNQVLFQVDKLDNLKNPSLDLKNSFCFEFQWIPSNAGRQSWKGPFSLGLLWWINSVWCLTHHNFQQLHLFWIRNVYTPLLNKKKSNFTKWT